MKNLVPADSTWAWPTLKFDIADAIGWLSACRDANVRYGLGSKVPFHGAKPGEDFMRVDCSGAVREMVYLATGADIGDGSVQQRECIERVGFKPSSVLAGKGLDNKVRIAFLSPADGGGVGHVVLIYNGKTLESHGGLGPDRRIWDGKGWQAKAKVWCLTR